MAAEITARHHGHQAGGGGEAAARPPASAYRAVGASASGDGFAEAGEGLVPQSSDLHLDDLTRA